MTPKIPITKPVFGPEEEAAIVKPLRSGWLVQGEFVSEFERKFTEQAQVAHAAACTSCTTGLHLAVAALGLKPGDEVIVPAFTWVSTANVVEYMGAKAVFCDIDMDTFNIDVSKIEACITPQTVGIIPVHLFGLCADMTPIQQLADAHNLWIVEDAACGFDAWYQGKHAGTMSDYGCFSFHPRKSITTGEGGMVTTNEADKIAQIRTLRDHGATRSDYQRHYGNQGFLLGTFNVLGYNFRMTDIQAAIGCVQMDRAEWIMNGRREAAAYYDEILPSLGWLQLPTTPPGYVHGYQAYVTRFEPETPTLDNIETLRDQRNRLMASLEDQGISTRQGTHAAAHLGYYANRYSIQPKDYPNAYMAEHISFTLPLYPQMTRQEQDIVLDALQQHGPRAS